MLLIDPLNRYPVGRQLNIKNAIGILPLWAAQNSDEESIKECLIKNYPYYFGTTMSGNIDNQGIYRYEGDPPLYPLASMVSYTGHEICYFYEYAIVAVVNSQSGDTWITRMD